MSKASRINLFSFATPQMRAFHMSWIAFLICFLAWFGTAPFMPIIRSELHLTPAQVGNLAIGSVAVTVLARLVAGWLCDRIGPRRTYSGLLVVGSIPVMATALSHSFETFLLARMAVGIIGASFVITQYHCSAMFAPNVVGTANATAAGWGNMGGGLTQFVMPLIFGGFVALGLSNHASWRAAMVVAGILCFITGIAYYAFTKDTPDGNLSSSRRPRHGRPGLADFFSACLDTRVWILFLIYGACFGVELTIDNLAHLYFTDYFHLGLKAAGWTAASFGMLNLFARALGGIVGDRMGIRLGARGRASWLFVVICLEGLLLMAFSRLTTLGPAIIGLLAFGLFVQMGCGATFAVVPFIRKQQLGVVSGIVGAGGNAGAIAAGFLFKGSMPWPSALLVLGGVVTISSFLALGIKVREKTTIEDERPVDQLVPAVA